MLYRITTPKVIAGAIVDDATGIVLKAAPWIMAQKGMRTLSGLTSACISRGYRLEKLHPINAGVATMKSFEDRKHISTKEVEIAITNKTQFEVVMVFPGTFEEERKSDEKNESDAK